MKRLRKTHNLLICHEGDLLVVGGSAYAKSLKYKAALNKASEIAKAIWRDSWQVDFWEANRRKKLSVLNKKFLVHQGEHKVCSISSKLK